uniref:Cytoplasmic protein n=1 Tax=Mesocestoides corti TaxID=53468 RepID=A0A5K3G6D9_MESCO
MAKFRTTVIIRPSTGELCIHVNKKFAGVIVVVQAGDTAQGNFSRLVVAERERESRSQRRRVGRKVKMWRH